MLHYMLLLGILQGIFEWFPISSEGIVALSSQFLVLGFNPVDIALFLHLGTVFAILVYFRKDWVEVARLKRPQLLRFLVIATLMSVVIGFPLYTIIRNAVVGVSLLVIMGFGLLLTSWFHKSKITLGTKVSRLAVIAGFLQGMAVIPGLSRSGATIFGLSLSDLSPSKILKLSYMMSVPVILGSTCFLVISNPVLVTGWPSLITSFMAGMFTLYLVMRISRKMNFYKFTLIFGLLCFLGAFVMIL